MAVGPFANEFDKDFGPEAGVDLGARYTVLGSDQPAGWKTVTNEPGGFVNLTRAFTPHENCSAYAVIYVRSPSARPAVLSAGSDDGIKAWFNRKLLISNNTSRGAARGQEKAEIALNAGWNEILYKVTQGGGGWGFYLDLLDPATGKPLDDLVYAPTPGK